MSKVEFSKDYMNLVKDLTSICNSVIFEKEEDKVIVRRSNPSQTIAYILTAPEKNFVFEGENVAFYNYREFCDLFEIFKNPTIEKSESQDKECFIISEEKSKIQYILSNPETISSGPKKIRFGEPTFVLPFKNDNLKEIKKMISLLGSEKTNIKVNGKEVTVRLFNNSHDNSFTKTYTIETECAESFDLTFSSEVFSLIPDKSYDIQVKKEGIIKFKMVGDENISLEIYTAQDEK